MIREIVLDTETTGLDPKSGHRLIEIACVELVDYIPTGRNFHRYIDPERDIDPDAERVHGLSRAFLTGKPCFAEAEVSEAFLEFVESADLIAHNAPFDRGFINAELEMAGFTPLHETRWIDTYTLAAKRYPGMYNSLDALCKRFRISLAEREKHGALIDARLLAEVYLELRGGREGKLDLAAAASLGVSQQIAQASYGPRPRPLASRVTAEEAAAHAAFIAKEVKEALWLKLDRL